MLCALYKKVGYFLNRPHMFYHYFIALHKKIIFACHIAEVNSDLMIGCCAGFCVLEFDKNNSWTCVQCKFQTEFSKQPPDQCTIQKWHAKFSLARNGIPFQCVPCNQRFAY